MLFIVNCSCHRFRAMLPSVQCGVLALDEPTTNLDQANIRAFAKALNNIINKRFGSDFFVFRANSNLTISRILISRAQARAEELPADPDHARRDVRRRNRQARALRPLLPCVQGTQASSEPFCDFTRFVFVTTGSRSAQHHPQAQHPRKRLNAPRRAAVNWCTTAKALSSCSSFLFLACVRAILCARNAFFADFAIVWTCPCVALEPRANLSIPFNLGLNSRLEMRWKCIFHARRQNSPSWRNLFANAVRARFGVFLIKSSTFDEN